MIPSGPVTVTSSRRAGGENRSTSTSTGPVTVDPATGLEPTRTEGSASTMFPYAGCWPAVRAVDPVFAAVSTACWRAASGPLQAAAPMTAAKQRAASIRRFAIFVLLLVSVAKPLRIPANMIGHQGRDEKRCGHSRSGGRSVSTRPASPQTASSSSGLSSFVEERIGIADQAGNAAVRCRGRDRLR